MGHEGDAGQQRVSDEVDVLSEMVEEVLSLLRQAVAEVELSRANVTTFLREAEALVRGMADLAER